MSAKRRDVSTDPNQPRCKHRILWGQCPPCRGNFGMLVVELGRKFGGTEPSRELVSQQVAESVERTRRGGGKITPGVRGRIDMLVAELDHLFFSPQPAEFIGAEVAECIQRMRIRKEEGTHIESSST